jgi:hypothetical protein
MIKYTKLRQKLKKEMKIIQNRQGVIYTNDLKNIRMSSPSSSISSSSILPTPPIADEDISRNSDPRSFKFQTSNNDSSIGGSKQHFAPSATLKDKK